MKIAVLIKQTPDTAELPKVSADAVGSHDIQTTMVINPWDEFAVEEAIRLAERFDGDSVAVTLSGAGETDALKHALAMGVDEARLIESEVNTGALDLLTTARILAAAITGEGDIDIILAGKQSVDGNSAAVHVGVARKLGLPLVTNVTKIVDVAQDTGDHGTITVERLVDGVLETVQAALPAVLSVSKEINEPRYPNIMGIRRAGRAQIPTSTPAELGITQEDRVTTWTNIRKPETRAPQVQFIEGANAAEKAQNLVDALLADKVI